MSNISKYANLFYMHLIFFYYRVIAKHMNMAQKVAVWQQEETLGTNTIKDINHRNRSHRQQKSILHYILTWCQYQASLHYAKVQFYHSHFHSFYMQYNDNKNTFSYKFVILSKLLLILVKTMSNASKIYSKSYGDIN